MLQHITILGRYTGSDKRGIIVGGIPFYPGMTAKKTRVTEETFATLLRGVENGWFEIIEHNYEKFVTSRFRNVTPIKYSEVKPAPVEEAPVEEAPVEETPVEETPVEETPVEETPVEETPVEEAPVEEAPVEETPVEEAPVVKKKNSRKKAEKVEE